MNLIFSFLSLPIILAIICIVHMLRTGKDRSWIFVVIFIPLLGSIVYIIVEMIPAILSGRSGHQLKQKVANTMFAGKKINELETLLKMSDTYTNRHALAEAYVENRLFNKAIEMFNSCCTGIYSEDPNLLQDIAYTHFLNNDYVKSRNYFERVMNKQQINKRYRTVYAKCLMETGSFDAAETEYKILEKEYVIEGIYGYAELLEKAGKSDQAKDKYEKIVFISKTLPKFVYREDRRWINLARDALRK